MFFRLRILHHSVLSRFLGEVEFKVERFLTLLTAHLVVALIILVGIGGATRVMEAGLACPDWPLCYGVLIPGRQMNLQVFLEWFHRLDAFLVGSALLILWASSLRKPVASIRWFPLATSFALLLVIAQGALGALTVTMQLASPLVSAHLLTALLLIAVLSAMYQRLGIQFSTTFQRPIIPTWWLIFPTLCLIIVLSQCLLGGAMASQWAVQQCFNSGESCHLLLLHRLSAYPAAVAVLTMAAVAALLPNNLSHLRRFSFAAAVIVLLQVAIGILTLRLQLSVPLVTITHQLLAALLVGLIGAVLGRSFPPQFHPITTTVYPEAAHG